MQRNWNRDPKVLALTSKHRVGRDLHAGAKTWNPQDRAFLDAGRNFDLDATASRELDGAARPAVDLREADRDRGLDVDCRLLPRPATVRPEDRAEDVAEASLVSEQVLHLLGRDRAVLRARAGVRAESAGAPTPARLRPRRLRGRPIRSELVVELALLGIVQHVMRLGDFLEASFGLLVARVQVGMVLARELAEGGRDLLLARRAWHAKHLVIVLHFWHLDYLLTRLRRLTNPGRGRYPSSSLM